MQPFVGGCTVRGTMRLLSEWSRCRQLVSVRLVSILDTRRDAVFRPEIRRRPGLRHREADEESSWYLTFDHLRPSPRETIHDAYISTGKRKQKLVPRAIESAPLLPEDSVRFLDLTKRHRLGYVHPSSETEGFERRTRLNFEKTPNSVVKRRPTVGLEDRSCASSPPDQNEAKFSDQRPTMIPRPPHLFSNHPPWCEQGVYRGRRRHSSKLQQPVGLHRLHPLRYESLGVSIISG